MKRFVGMILCWGLGGLLTVSAEPVVQAVRDFNADGQQDRLSIQLEKGRRYDDTEPWEGAGEKTEGQFSIRIDITGKPPVVQDLNALFYPHYAEPEPMFFWTQPWSLQWADYNHDGQLDFNLGQYFSGVACVFRLFTVSPEGRVSELPVEDRPDGVLGPRGSHSTGTFETNRTGFSHTYYDRQAGTDVKDVYRWDQDRTRFVRVTDDRRQVDHGQGEAPTAVDR